LRPGEETQGHMLPEQRLPLWVTPVSIFSARQQHHSSFQVGSMIVSGYKKFSDQSSISSEYGLEGEVCNVWFTDRWTLHLMITYVKYLYISENTYVQFLLKRGSCTMVN